MKAIEDVSSIGYKGIQLRASAVTTFGDRPQALRDLLSQHHLAFAVLSSGNLVGDPAVEQDQLALHVDHAQFVRAAGGQFLQVIDERPKGRPVTAADYYKDGTAADRARQAHHRRRGSARLPPSHEQHRREAAGDRCGSRRGRFGARAACCSTSRTTSRAAAIRSRRFDAIANGSRSFT